MNKKNIIIRLIIFLVLVALLVPAFSVRISNEKENKDVLFALNYNNAHMVLSSGEFEETLKTNKKMGVNTLYILEENLNSMVNAGVVTAIKYNVLAHKYDDESEAILKQLSTDKKIHNDSYILITKRPETKKFLAKWIPAKFNKSEYTKKETPEGADVYALYEENSDTWKISMGFDEEKIKNAKEKNFDVVLAMMLGSFSNTRYIDYMEEIIEKYDIRFINIKPNHNNEEKSKNAKKNYSRMCRLIEEKELFLIVTENADQLSNQKPIGYKELTEAAGGRILRGYDTVDYGIVPLVETRYHQITNSVVDRNLRFVLINQILSTPGAFKAKSDTTNKATKMSIQKLNELGYNTESYSTVFDYKVERRVISMIALAIMILMGLTMIELIFGIRNKKLTIASVIAAVLGAGFTYLAPEKIVELYPTLFAAIAPCFAITVVLAYIKAAKEKLSWFVLLITTVLISLVTLCLCGLIQSVLLSGLDYYINTLIFRGIKISLILPVVFSALAFGIMFIEKNNNYIEKTMQILKMDIKVYWIFIAGALLFVARTYLLRSGNVATISSIESLMRNAITELTEARPRTKEFLVGWPCLVLFVYYIKNVDFKLFSWLLSIGSSILFASVINSFCHVFTTVDIIYGRVINGLLIGAIVCVFALVINAVLIRIVKYLYKKYFNTEG